MTTMNDGLFMALMAAVAVASVFAGWQLGRSHQRERSRKICRAYYEKALGDGFAELQCEYMAQGAMEACTKIEASIVED